MKYALFSWYCGEGNKYSFIGSLTEEEYNSYSNQSFNNFVIFKCHSHIERDLEDRVYFDNKGNSYVYSSGIWKTGYA